MKKPFFAFLMAAALLPFAAAPVLAQQAPGPNPEIRTQVEQIRNTAKVNAFNALSQDHRDKVNAIISQVNGGTLDRDAAAQQIDAILTPPEAQAVIAQSQSMRRQMRQLWEQNGGQNGGFQRQGGNAGGERGGFGGANRQGENGQRRGPDAGRMLLMLGANHRERPAGGQPQ